MNIKTFGPHQPPLDCIIPNQTHSCNILEVKTGQEDLSDCDGLWTKNLELALGVKTADCAPIVFYDDEKFGIIHAGWRGLCCGIVEKMCKTFYPHSTNIWVGPILPIFEIQKDGCYDQIYTKFGDKFFEYRNHQILFNFKAAIAHILPMAEFDQRATYDSLDLASWRRDQDQQRNLTIISKS